MLVFRIILFLLVGFGLLGLVGLLGFLAIAFLSTDMLIKIHIATDNWALRPINKIAAWFIEVRQFHYRDG